MKISISIFIFCVVLSFKYSLNAQNDSLRIMSNDSIPTIEEIYNDDPPCGIPCSWIFDEFGNFKDCLSPCCNCREVFRLKNLDELFLKIDSNSSGTLLDPIPIFLKFNTKDKALEYFRKQEE